MPLHSGRLEFFVKNGKAGKFLRSAAAAAAICACVSMFTACTDGRNSDAGGSGDLTDRRPENGSGMIGGSENGADPDGGMIGGAAPGMGNEPSR